MSMPTRIPEGKGREGTSFRSGHGVTKGLSPSGIYFRAVADIYGNNHQLVFPYLRQQPIISDPVTPKPPEGSGESFSGGPGIRTLAKMSVDVA